MLHRFIAALPAFLRERNIGTSLCVLTTNYDTLMEQALTENGEDFQLLYYVNAGSRREGCFLERSPDGIIRQIDRAENMRFRETSRHLVVKLNGGISYFGDMAEQASVERGQFERLAQRIPEVLPGYLRRELDACSMLSLGHGLAEPDVGAIYQGVCRLRDASGWILGSSISARPGNLPTVMGGTRSGLAQARADIARRRSRVFHGKPRAPARQNSYDLVGPADV